MMRRRQPRIRRWLALATAIATLGFASSAQAMVAADGGGGYAGGTPQTIVVTGESSNGFSWSDAAVGAGVALGAALGGVGVLRAAGSRRRLAGLAQS